MDGKQKRKAHPVVPYIGKKGTYESSKMGIRTK
jgi:hypothetical protein